MLKYVCLCVTQAKILISKCIAIVKFLGIEIEIGMVFSRADSIIMGNFYISTTGLYCF